MSSVESKALLKFLIIIAALAFAGCAKEESAYDKLWDDVFSTCGPSCHEPTGTVGDGPDLSSKDSFHANLVNKGPADYPGWTSRQANCTALFIEPGDATNSTVVASLDASNTVCPDAYSFHTAVNVSVNAAQLADIKSWINDGAPKED